MVKLQKMTRRTSLTLLAHKSALATVSLPDGALHVCGDMAMALGLFLERAWLIRGRKLGFFQVPNELFQGALQYFPHVSGGYMMAEQLLRATQQVMRALSDAAL